MKQNENVCVSLLQRPAMSYSLSYCPALSYSLSYCPALSYSLSYCPALSYSLSYCPALSYSLSYCPALSYSLSYCPALSYSLSYCPALSILLPTANGGAATRDLSFPRQCVTGLRPVMCRGCPRGWSGLGGVAGVLAGRGGGCYVSGCPEWSAVGGGSVLTVSQSAGGAIIWAGAVTLRLCSASARQRLAFGGCADDAGSMLAHVAGGVRAHGGRPYRVILLRRPDGSFC